MKKLAILGAGTVGGSCAEILLRDAAVLEKNAGESIELAYVVDLRDMPDAPFHDKMVKDFTVVEQDPEVFLVIEAIGGCGALLSRCIRKAEVIAYALDTIGLTDKTGAVMVGDREHDVIGAKKNALPCIGALYGYGTREELRSAGAAAIADTVEDLHKLLLG